MAIVRSLRSIAALAAVVTMTVFGDAGLAAQAQRVIIVQDDSGPGTSPVGDHIAYRLSIALDDALRDAGFEVLPVTSHLKVRLTPRAAQPEPRLASALIVASVERPIYVLALSIVQDVKEESGAPGRESVRITLQTRVLSYKGSQLAETMIEPQTVGAQIARGCRDDCLLSAIRDPLREPLRRIADAARAAAARAS